MTLLVISACTLWLGWKFDRIADKLRRIAVALEKLEESLQ